MSILQPLKELLHWNRLRGKTQAKAYLKTYFDTLYAAIAHATQSTGIDMSAASRVLGRAASGAGKSEELTLSQVLDMVGSAAEGDILYRGASAWSRLAKGAALQVLRQNSGLTAPEWSTGREVLTAARTYYVRTDGNDSNSGLADTAGGAFLTIQKAVDAWSVLDNSGFGVTIQVRDGTFNESLTLKSAVGSGSLTIQGNSSTPTNVVVNYGSGSATVAVVNCVNQASTFILKDFKITCTGGSAIRCQQCYIEISGLDFGACLYHVHCLENGYVQATGNYTISAGAGYHWVANAGFVRVTSRTVTISGTPAFTTAFAGGNRTAVLVVGSNTFSGSATGSRYMATNNAVIDTGGGGATYLPGDSGGSTATGGVYA